MTDPVKPTPHLSFNHESLGELRIVRDNHDRAWYCLLDVANILGYSTSYHVGRLLQKDRTINLNIGHNKGRGSHLLRFVNQEGLNHLLYRCRKDQVQVAKEWLTVHIFPKFKGMYGTSKPIVVEEQHQGIDDDELVPRAIAYLKLKANDKRKELQEIEKQLNQIQSLSNALFN